MSHLERYHVRPVGSQKITRFTDSRVETVEPEGKRQVFAGDTYVLALGVEPNNQLANEIRSRYATDVYVVGDCVAKGKTKIGRLPVLIPLRLGGFVVIPALSRLLRAPGGCRQGGNGKGGSAGGY